MAPGLEMTLIGNQRNLLWQFPHVTKQRGTPHAQHRPCRQRLAQTRAHPMTERVSHEQIYRELGSIGVRLNALGKRYCCRLV